MRDQTEMRGRIRIILAAKTNMNYRRPPTTRIPVNKSAIWFEMRFITFIISLFPFPGIATTCTWKMVLSLTAKIPKIGAWWMMSEQH